MTYEDTKRTMMTAYPSLFVDEADVLHQLFFVNGNGYEWVDGELSDGEEPEETIRQARAQRKHFNERFKRPTLDRFDEFLKSVMEEQTGEEAAKTAAEILARSKEREADLMESDDPEVEREKEKRKRLEYAKRPNSDCYFLRPDGTVGRVLYPLCEYADILHVPDDVKPDWLAAAKRAIVIARSEFRITPEDEEWLRKAEAKLTP